MERFLTGLKCDSGHRRCCQKTCLLSANNPEIAARLRRRAKKSLIQEGRTRCSQSVTDSPDKNATTRSLVGSRVGQTRQGAEDRDSWMLLSGTWVDEYARSLNPCLQRESTRQQAYCVHSTTFCSQTMTTGRG